MGKMEGGGLLYRLFSKRSTSAGGPAGQTSGKKDGACNTVEQATGGIQFAASFVRRCRLVSGEGCVCTDLETKDEGVSVDEYRVATLTVSAHTTTTITPTNHCRHEPSSRFLGRNMRRIVALNLPPYKIKQFAASAILVLFDA
jgi:hypothetical protein